MLKPAVQTSLLVKISNVFPYVGNVMVILIVVMPQMKMDVAGNQFVHKTGFAAVMEPASVVTGNVMAKMIVMMDQMRLDVVSTEIVHEWEGMKDVYFTMIKWDLSMIS